MEIVELALIPSPGDGHLAPSVELGKILTSRDHRISVTIFIMETPFQSTVTSYTQTLLSNQPPPRVRFVQLILEDFNFEVLSSKFWLPEIVEINKSRVKDFYLSNPTLRPKAFVLDMFCTAFMDVASELGASSYVFFTSNACFASLLFYLQFLQDDQNQDLTEFKDADIELSIPGFANPVPAKVLPSVILNKEHGWSALMLNVPRTMRKAKGILVNTFAEFESYAIECLSKDDTVPPIYTVGPVLNLEDRGTNDTKNLDQYEEIMKWLDCQPLESVLFLCFGSMGTIVGEQVIEIAHALEQSGHRFLWALRRPSPKEKIMQPPSEYENFSDVLPQGFLERTKGIGKVIGWAPQVAVLSHQAVGGFVSHCGWNSIMESLWFGVPIATWPLYAEQQMNAFKMVKESGIAVEIKLDFRADNPITLTSEEIERAIKQLMEDSESSEIKMKVRVKKEESRRAMVEGGSSYLALGQFIEEVVTLKNHT